MQNIFKKVDVNSQNEENEYDKFFQQPMELLAYSGVLNKIKKGTKNYYTVANEDILKYIAIRERNALNFLNIYITKVLNDSNLFETFNDFFLKQTKASYDDLKEKFYLFTTKYTNIGSKTRTKPNPGKIESDRIFTKIINPLAF
ncbi:hypothetical protein J6P59_04145 [bacterium]|nr:hypothetical protein [bacterium]MBO6072793.1 hypothetical protein [bacterium]MBO7044107.1 hypothetical protein [bacterium]